MQRSFALLMRGWAAVALVAACGGDDDPTEELPPLFEPKPECAGDSIVPFAGKHTQLINTLEIGAVEDGFDLDGDGKPDNKLAGVGSFAGSAITDALNDFSLMIPIEMFDLPNAGADACIKFALYLGLYAFDRDEDGRDTAVNDGDCNDHVAEIRPGNPELPGNRIDDDCDGLADEDGETPSADPDDMDGDGVSLAAGDCDDTNAMISPELDEICGDGYDNDCDGVADRTEDEQGNHIACNPYDATPDEVTIDPRSFDTDGSPFIQFTSGEITSEGGKLKLTAGPSLFQIAVPVTRDIILDLKITGATIEGDLELENGRVVIKNGRLGGVIDARTADTIRGLTFEDIMLKPEDSLLDAIFGNVLGSLLVLPAQRPSDPYPGCRMPDIDVDRDGREAFCDTDADGDPETKVVDLCIDGDGTEIRDEVVGGVVKQCTEALDDKGRPRFVDGISVEINFSTASADLVRQP